MGSALLQDIALLPPWYQNQQSCHMHLQSGNASFNCDHCELPDNIP